MFRIGKPAAEERERLDESEKEEEEEARRQQKNDDEILQMKIGRLYHPRTPYR